MLTGEWSTLPPSFYLNGVCIVALGKKFNFYSLNNLTKLWILLIVTILFCYLGHCAPQASACTSSKSCFITATGHVAGVPLTGRVASAIDLERIVEDYWFAKSDQCRTAADVNEDVSSGVGVTSESESPIFLTTASVSYGSPYQPSSSIERLLQSFYFCLLLGYLKNLLTDFSEILW